MDALAYIGDNLRRLREARYYSQRDLAKIAGLSPTTILKLEQDRAEPHPRTIRKLAAALDVHPDVLVKGTTNEGR
jgi:transcriptional regulator with XRE-family HTH domain